MAVLAGSGGDIYIATGSGSTFTTEATTLVSGTTYQINDTSKRRWDPTATFIVYDGGSPVDAGLYYLIHATGKVQFISAPGGAVTVSGKYLTVSQFAQATEWSVTAGFSLQPSAVFGATWEANTATQGKGTAMVKRFTNQDGYFTTYGGQLFLLELHMVAGAQKMVCFGYADHAIDVSNTGLTTESPSFTLSGAVDYVSS